MTNLRVSHLSVRQSDCQTACLSLYKRALAHKLVHDRGFALADCVSLTVVIQSISIQDH